MISQRDINQFFTVIDILSDPEKMKAELLVLQNMRASVDADMQKLGEEKQKVSGLMIEAQAILTKKGAIEKEQESVFAAQEVKAKELELFDGKLRNAAAQQQEIKRLLDERAKQLDAREQEIVDRAEAVTSKEVNVNMRDQALRTKEADYTARMSKLRQIAE